MTSEQIQSLSIKEIVTSNFHAAAVFEKYSLDFCCRGGKTVRAACVEKHIDAKPVIEELSMIDRDSDHAGMRFAEWEPDFLITYIVQNHHTYVLKMIPVLYTHTQKIATVHGSNHPELIEIAKHFETIALELKRHMMKEEEILFPFINELQLAKKTQHTVRRPHFGSVQNPITMMEAEHQLAGDEMYMIRTLSNNYTVPEDGCTTYRVTYQELQDFELDLHRHVHLENNILFPMAVKLEHELIL